MFDKGLPQTTKPSDFLAHDEWCLIQLKEKVKMDKFVKVVWELNE